MSAPTQEELAEQVAAMTIVIAALHHTITQGEFQTITFHPHELVEVEGSRVALQPTEAGGVTVLLELPEGDGHAQEEAKSAAREGASDHGVVG